MGKNVECAFPEKVLSLTQLLYPHNLCFQSPELSILPFQQNGSSTIGSHGGHYTLHQAKGNAAAGNKKSGYLNKRSEGRLRNVWQKRRCEVGEGVLEIYHADESKPPTQVNLLTCQMKHVADDKQCFDVVSYNRTYHFQVRRMS